MSSQNEPIIEDSYFRQYVDGWQAYCAGRDKRSNPHKHQKGSDAYRTWVEAFDNAKRAEAAGHMKPLETFDPKVSAAQAYIRRHGQ